MGAAAADNIDKEASVMNLGLRLARTQIATRLSPIWSGTAASVRSSRGLDPPQDSGGAGCEI